MEAIDVSNGVIHIIDGVLLPNWVNNSIPTVLLRTVLEHSSCPRWSCELGGALADLESSHGRSYQRRRKLPASTVAFLTSSMGRPL
jgi:hypothetical protein